LDHYYPLAERSMLMLLFPDLWFVQTALATLKETNRWLAFLSSVQWEQTNNPRAPNSG
jgi:hypothetical protein